MIELYLKDDNFRHCEFSNNPQPVINRSKYIKWNRDTPPAGTDVVCTDFQIQNGNIAWLLEPYDIHPVPYQIVTHNPYVYKEIWTHDRIILDKKLLNVKFFPVGGCWIDEQDRKVHDKTKMFSIIASSKRQTQGHKLRHEIIQAAGNHIDAFGPEYMNFKVHSMHKIEGLQDYRYHFAIENCKRDYYFSEKLIDALMTGCIPIYWGCPSIGNFFNTDGFIEFNNLVDLKESLKNCTIEYYNSKLPIIKDNFELAKKYILSEDWIYEHYLSKS